MSDEAIVKVGESTEESFHLIATDPAQMASSQAFLKNWLTKKVRESNHEFHEVSDALEIALKNKWGTSALRSQVSRTKGRLTYYKKLLVAVDAGYSIVPNFPIDLFAVRVKRATPASQWGRVEHAGDYSSADGQIRDEKPQILPPGEGRYVNPEQKLERDSREENDSKGQKMLVKTAWPSDFQDVQFPLVAARPEVMEATAAAMLMNVFDGVGICPPVRRGDPLIIGKIFGQKEGWTQKEVSFLIAWHLDLRVL